MPCGVETIEGFLETSKNGDGTLQISTNGIPEHNIWILENNSDVVLNINKAPSGLPCVELSALDGFDYKLMSRPPENVFEFKSIKPSILMLIPRP